MVKTDNRLPLSIKVRRHLEVEINLLNASQLNDLMEMYSTLDDKSLARLPYDVNSPHYPRVLKRQLEDNRAIFLVAWHDGKIIGSLALYHGQALWTRHVGRVIFVSHPEYRRYGLATVLFEEMIPLAQAMEIEKLYAQLTKDHVDGIKMLKTFGFAREATLKDHIKDRYGRYHDMRIYSLDLEGAHKSMEELISSFSDYSG
ncbi:GNAT family N-acetyltransferase [bacterium]|nr:GNAT family N-acetyltransferase [bacterium]